VPDAAAAASTDSCIGRSAASTKSTGSMNVMASTEPPTDVPTNVAAFVEAALGLGLLALLISYLPSIYSAFSRREALVGMLEVRAGLPPSPAELLTRYSRIGFLDKIDEDLFEHWETWFVEVEESHTSQPSLSFFRSPHPQRSWITASGCVLDTPRGTNGTIAVPVSGEAVVTVNGHTVRAHAEDGYVVLTVPGGTYDITVNRD